jgi:predicted DsbA family dithiol-disulfide isomerase
MTGPEILRFFFDYVDPASFLLEQRLQTLEAGGVLSLSRESFELRPPPAPILDPQEERWTQHWRSMQEAAADMDMVFPTPWIVPWTRKAHELAHQARQEGCFPEIHEALFRAYLFEGQDIGRIDILVELARRHDMDPTGTKAALDVDLHGDSVLQKRREGLEEGLTRPPALLWRGRTLEGYPDADALEMFLAFNEEQTT